MKVGCLWGEFRHGCGMLLGRLGGCDYRGIICIGETPARWQCESRARVGLLNDRMVELLADTASQLAAANLKSHSKAADRTTPPRDCLESAVPRLLADWTSLHNSVHTTATAYKHCRTTSDSAGYSSIDNVLSLGLMTGCRDSSYRQVLEHEACHASAPCIMQIRRCQITHHRCRCGEVINHSHQHSELLEELHCLSAFMHDGSCRMDIEFQLHTTSASHYFSHARRSHSFRVPNTSIARTENAA